MHALKRLAMAAATIVAALAALAGTASAAGADRSRFDDSGGWMSPPQHWIEVCDALDISEANQRVLLLRGRSRLRQALVAEMRATIRLTGSLRVDDLTPAMREEFATLYRRWREQSQS